MAAQIVDRDALDALISVLRAEGRTVLGPTVRDGAVTIDELGSAAELPAGWTAEHGAGEYRLERRADGALFGWAVGPQPWKHWLHVPEQRLWSATRRDGEVEVEPDAPVSPRYALFGVRPCDVEALAIQDRVFLGGPFPDAFYGARRESLFIVAVSCAEPGDTCFCASMGAGPGARAGHDLALTELLDDSGHRFLVDVGSEAGAAVLAGVPHREASEAETVAARALVKLAASHMGRTLDTDGLPEALAGALEHPRWAVVADRCLACGNCTLVCPTCFCSTIQDLTDLRGARTERWRRWDSCFSTEFSHIHGGSVRPSTRSRYRQWLTHKLGTWTEQFGTPGCVGCGRCITWCPVGIDITEEAAALRAPRGRGGAP